jgi:hypothetical protein
MIKKLEAPPPNGPSRGWRNLSSHAKPDRTMPDTNHAWSGHFIFVAFAQLRLVGYKITCNSFGSITALLPIMSAHIGEKSKKF